MFRALRDDVVARHRAEHRLHVQANPMHAGFAAGNVIGEFILDPTTGRPDFRFARCSRKWFWWTKSTAASPRTQAAMLEAMGEGMVSMDKVSYRSKNRSWSWRRKIRSSRKGHFDCPKRKWIVSFALEPRYPDAAEEKKMCERIRRSIPSKQSSR